MEGGGGQLESQCVIIYREGGGGGQLKRVSVLSSIGRCVWREVGDN